LFFISDLLLHFEAKAAQKREGSRPNFALFDGVKLGEGGQDVRLSQSPLMDLWWAAAARSRTAKVR